jgi:hypothetical protein
MPHGDGKRLKTEGGTKTPFAEDVPLQPLKVEKAPGIC